ncbi:MAG: leishmanolysin-related zinc metalloendopeptidase [Alteraurantiacibacter sp.]
MFKDFRVSGVEGTLGFAPGRALGHARVLPEVEQVDLVREIEVDHFKFDPMDAKPDGAGKPGGGGGGGGGGGNVPAPYTSGPADSASGFNITILFEGTWTQDLYNIFVAAADFYTSLITGDLADVTITSGRGKRATTETIDDVVITASLVNIDGTGGVLGRAGPSSSRTDSQLTVKGIMEFDIADTGDFNAAGLFDDIVLHEMGHVLGFGTLWDRLGLINPDNTFGGELASAEHALQFNGDSTIDIETDGGQGTAFGHWDDATYTNELMTGYISNPNYYSYFSAAAYADMGYQLADNWKQVVDDLNLA